jgi:hypothetical protein
LPVPTKAQREEMVALLASTGRALQRVFLINVTIALVAIYITLDAWDKLPLGGPVSSPLTTVVQGSLDDVGPVIRVGTYLKEHPDLVQQYRSFLGPLEAIDDAAMQAIVAVSPQDPAWLNLNPEDRNDARDFSAGLATLDAYSNDDLQSASVSYVQAFYRLLVKPEIERDNQRVLKRLKAAAKVAQALGAKVTIPDEWPASVHFPDFVKQVGGHAALVAMLDEARSLDDFDADVRALEEVCSANKITPCTASGIGAVLNSGRLRIPTEDIERTIELSFLPTGFQPRLLLALSPVALLIGTYLFLSLHWRRGRLLGALKAEDGPEDLISPETPWLLPSALVPEPPSSLFHATHRLVLRAVLWAGELLPVVAQIVVLLYLNYLRTTGVRSIAWMGIGGIALVLTAFGVFTLALEQYQEGRSRLQRRWKEESSLRA